MKIRSIDRKKYTLSIDRTKNRVYFHLHTGLWNEEDLECLMPDWKEIIAEIQPNFTILSDLRNLQIQSPKFDRVHEEAQRFVTQNGLLKLARITTTNDIVNLQFGRITERSAIPQNTFYNVEDAEKYLDELVEKFEEKNS